MCFHRVYSHCTKEQPTCCACASLGPDEGQRDDYSTYCVPCGRFWERQRELSATVNLPGLTPFQPGLVISSRGEASGAVILTSRRPTPQKRSWRGAGRRRHKRNEQNNKNPSSRIWNTSITNTCRTEPYGRRTSIPDGASQSSQPRNLLSAPSTTAQQSYKTHRRTHVSLPDGVNSPTRSQARRDPQPPPSNTTQRPQTTRQQSTSSIMPGGENQHARSQVRRHRQSLPHSNMQQPQVTRGQSTHAGNTSLALHISPDSDVEGSEPATQSFSDIFGHDDNSDGGGLDDQNTPFREDQQNSEGEWNIPSSAPRLATSSFVAESPPKSPDRRKLAEESSVLLEYYSRIGPDEVKGTHDERGRIIDNVIEKLSMIKGDNIHGHSGLNRQGDVNRKLSVSGAEDKGSNSDCITCCSHVANILLIPCHHLVLCEFCCEEMGIRGNEVPGLRTAPCPICRGEVLDIAKIFRG